MTTAPRTPPATDVDVVVVGAGFAGLYMLHRLRENGFTAQVLEAGRDVGGTWYWNRYPGARCDSASYYYSFSFSEQLQQEWTWSEVYAPQPEILAYLQHVADRFDLRRDIRFNARVASAEFTDAGIWLLRTENGDQYRAKYFVTAVGCLSAANIPQIPGLDTFGGEWYHTGEYPHEGVDFTGKRVAVVGTGSTGIQAIPVIAEQAAELTVFQRTPNYSVPARNGPTEADFDDWVKDNYAEIRGTQRQTTNGHPYFISGTSALEVGDDERQRRYEDAWQAGGLRFRATFRDLLSSKEANDTASDFIRSKIAETVRDPETARKLMPHDHGYATKRPPIDTHYFETYNHDHVHLVDVRATPIVEATATGLRTADAEYPLDTIVFATGFDALTGPLLNIDIRGTDGVRLRDEWSAGPYTYLGLGVAGFPNMFTITGPGSPSVLTNMPTAIEQHVDWITDCLKYLRDNGIARMEPREDAAREWVAEVNAAADKTLLPTAKTSWYLGANVPGKPRVFLPYAGGLATYATICADVAAKDYAGFVLG